MTDFLTECVNTFDSLESSLRERCDSLWDEISLRTQESKLSAHGIMDAEKRNRILSDLKQRPSFLVHVALRARNEGFGIRNIAEVGTAQGLQSIVFAKTIPECQVYTCDIKDDRSTHVFSTCENIDFVLGDALKLKEKIKESSERNVDFCWVDGSHDHYAVIDDFLSLLPCTHKDTIWAFDDFDQRFGCFRDLNVLLRHFKEHVVLDLGLTASGNPNRIMLARRFT